MKKTNKVKCWFCKELEEHTRKVKSKGKIRDMCLVCWDGYCFMQEEKQEKIAKGQKT